MSRAVHFAPLVLLLLVVGALVWRLATPPDTRVHSKLEGKPIPVFVLAAALPTKPTVSSSELATGKPRLLNIFASWCIPCISEVKVLQQLKGAGVAIDGIAIRDRQDDIAAFLARNGTRFSETATRREIAGILGVLGKLHRGQALHRDLTPLNIRHILLATAPLARATHSPQGK